MKKEFPDWIKMIYIYVLKRGLSIDIEWRSDSPVIKINLKAAAHK